MLFGGGGGAKPAEGGGGDKKDGGFNMGNMMEGLKKANEIGQKTKDLQKVSERVIAAEESFARYMCTMYLQMCIHVHVSSLDATHTHTRCFLQEC